MSPPHDPRATGALRPVVALLLVTLPAALGAVGACAKEEPIQYPQQPVDAGPPPTQTAPPPPPADAGPPPPPADAMTTVLPTDVEKMLQDAIKTMAGKEARGMKAEGDLIKGAVQQGGQLEQQIMIQAGKCYSIIGMAGPVITELDIELRASSPLPIPLPGGGLVVAVDGDQGPEATIAPCWKNLLGVPFPATVVLKATVGNGPMAAQVFVK